MGLPGPSRSELPPIFLDFKIHSDEEIWRIQKLAVYVVLIWLVLSGFWFWILLWNNRVIHPISSFWSLLELFVGSTFDISLLTPESTYTQVLGYPLGVALLGNRASICLCLEEDMAEVTEKFCNQGGAETCLLTRDSRTSFPFCFHLGPTYCQVF